MSAHADDLRHYYAEHIGPSVVLAAVGSGVAVALPAKLVPGRYMITTQTVAGAALLWIRQGAFGVLPAAVAAAPCTPVDLAEIPRQKLTFMVRPDASGNRGGQSIATDGLSLITNAGTVTVVITRISHP